MKKILVLTTAVLLASTSAHADTATHSKHPVDAMQKKHSKTDVSFNRLDLNNDGEVTINEYNALNAVTHNGVHVSFQDMDMDGSGVITRDEAQSFKTKGPDWEMKTKITYEYEQVPDGQVVTEITETYAVESDMKKRMDIEKQKHAGKGKMKAKVKSSAYSYNN